MSAALSAMHAWEDDGGPAIEHSELDCSRASLLAKIAASKPLDSPVTHELLCWALDLDPQSGAALNTLGLASMKRKDYPKAFAYFKRACLAGSELAAFVNAAIAADHAGDLPEAKRFAGLALDAEPDSALARLAVFGLLERESAWDEQELLIAEGLNLDPDSQVLLFARSEIKMRRGDWGASSWLDYQHRPTRLHLTRHMDEYPEWHGEPIAGKTILVMREQGMGDEIQYSRYYRVLAAMGARVILFTYPSLARLFSGVPGVSSVVTNEEYIPDFDYWMASGSLALAAGDFDPCLAVAPRILASADDARMMSRFLANNGNLRVGLRWAGNPDQPRERFRRIPYASIRPLFDLPYVDFYSLQDGEAANESDLPDLSKHTHDIADMAGAIANLDLVISSDTMVAHLAASLGKPTWLMLKDSCDCRWELGRSRRSGFGFSVNTDELSRWYPTMRIFRAESGGPAHLRESLKPYAMGPVHNRYKNRPAVPDATAIALAGETKYGRMQWHSNDKYIGRSLGLYGEYSSGECAILEQLLSPGHVVIDAGANVGALTIPMADRVGAAGTVFAFEPQPEYFALLRANTESRRNIVPVNAGLGETSGALEIPRVEMSRISAPSWDTGQAVIEALQITIDAFANDRCLERLDLIKIDVDGPEHQILKGARLSIQRFRPLIFCEYDKPGRYPDLIPWLMSSGYRIYRTQPKMWSPANWAHNPVNVFGNLISLMLVCVPAERREWRIDTFSFPAEHIRPKNN